MEWRDIITRIQKLEVGFLCASKMWMIFLYLFWGHTQWPQRTAP